MVSKRFQYSLANKVGNKFQTELEMFFCSATQLCRSTLISMRCTARNEHWKNCQMLFEVRSTSTNWFKLKNDFGALHQLRKNPTSHLRDSRHWVTQKMLASAHLKWAWYSSFRSKYFFAMSPKGSFQILSSCFLPDRTNINLPYVSEQGAGC